MWMLTGERTSAAIRVRGSPCSVAPPTKAQSMRCTRSSHAGGPTATTFALLGQQYLYLRNSLTPGVGNHQKERVHRSQHTKFGSFGRRCGNKLLPPNAS